MARPLVFTFPAAATTAICLAQTTAGAANLIINGTLVNPANLTPSVTLPNYNRTVSLTSTGDLSASNITITGLDFRGNAVTQTISGPNNNTVQTTSLFNVITSVATDSALATAMSVGTGSTGISTFYKVNFNSDVFIVTLGNHITGTINYSVNQTLDFVDSTTTPFMYAIDAELTSATTSIIYASDVPVVAYQVTINSSTGGTLTTTFLQQGIAGS